MQRLSLRRQSPVREMRESSASDFGVVVKLPDPFNLFIHQPSLLDEDERYIYVMAYSLGKVRLAVWGVYDKDDDRVELDGACRYAVAYLNDTVKIWKNRRYSYISNIVENRITPTMQRYGVGSSTHPDIGTDEDYRYAKYLVAIILGDRDMAELPSRDVASERVRQRISSIQDRLNRRSELGLLSLDEEMEGVQNLTRQQLRREAESLDRQIEEYEKSMNLQSIGNVPWHTRVLVTHITDRFYDAIKYGQYTNNPSVFDACPTPEECMAARDQCPVFDYGTKIIKEDPSRLR